jgi:hypothetical protein
MEWNKGMLLLRRYKKGSDNKSWVYALFRVVTISGAEHLLFWVNFPSLYSINKYGVSFLFFN